MSTLFSLLLLILLFLFSLIAITYNRKANQDRFQPRISDEHKTGQKFAESDGPSQSKAEKVGIDVADKAAHNSPETNLPPSSVVEHHTCNHKTGGRNLVLCVDGTANQFGEMNTNVIELYNIVLKGDDDNQRTWYNSGIGTYVRSSFSFAAAQQFVFHKIDTAIAWNFEKTIQEAYRWLSDNYRPGDCIFLFGFSRGAYQVRVLSAMIDKVGLIYKGNETQIPFAYELYADPASNVVETVTQVGSSQTKKISSASRFKKAFSYQDVKVHFVGAWDTVSSIGIARGKYMLPGTVDGMHHVCYFRHALALDERRVKFLPEYAYGGRANLHANSEPKEEDSKPSERQKTDATSASSKRPHTLEVWFAGTHSDIGGGNVENAGMDRSRPPLRWMVFEAGYVGLRTAPFERKLVSEEQIEVKESLTGLWWWFLEYLPLTRLTYQDSDIPGASTYWPHLGAHRTIHLGQKIHSSWLLADKLKGGYTPKAHPLREISFWDGVRKHGLGKWLELDLYDYVDKRVNHFVETLNENLLEDIRKIESWANGQQAVRESLYRAIISTLESNSDNKLENPLRLLELTSNILKKSPIELKAAHSDKLRNLTSCLLGDDVIRRHAVKTFLARCTDSPEMEVLRGHSSAVESIAISPDGKLIASGSGDKTIRIWNPETGMQVGETLNGHTAYVRSVAFSPDGKRIVSGSDDCTIRLWDSATGKQIGAPLQGHTFWVLSVAFSPDGTRIVSGSRDETVRIWSCVTGEQIGEPLAGHTHWVRSVAFSLDGTRVVSGSNDYTIRLWDSQTGTQISQPFTGHRGGVTFVAFSPDGKHIVSSSGDKTICVWDARTGKQVGEPFQGHRDLVYSVAFSPDGRRVVSGSVDKTVRIWDVGTGRQVGEPLRGHTAWVNSVVFSPDGKRVVSGSDDKTVRVWDVEMYMDAD